MKWKVALRYRCESLYHLTKSTERKRGHIILCNNHPSGSLKLSRADEQLTQKIKQAASYLDIRVPDHRIVSEDGYYSFADEGLIKA